jgi:hypothetical protein
MTTSQKSSFLTEVLEGTPIPVGVLAYFRAQLRYSFHDLVLREFLRQEDKEGFTQADLARRIHRKPSQVSKLLGAPGNWTFNTVSDLLLGMKALPDVSIMSLEERTALDWGDSEDSVSLDKLEKMPAVSDRVADENG